MSNDTQDVTVETTADADTQGQVAENAVETEADEIEDNSPDAESEGTEDGESENDEPTETVEEKLTRLERETEAKQKALDRKTAGFKERERKRDEELAQLREQIARANQQPQTDGLKEPNIEHYDSYAEYEKAKEEFIREKTKKEIEQNLLAQQKQALIQKIQAERAAKETSQEAEFIKIKPDYVKSKEEVYSFIPDLRMPEETRSAILDTVYEGNLPQIIDYFGSNDGERLDELSRISKLTPAKAAIEIYKIQQGLKAPVKKEMKPAPKPIPKVKGTSAPKDLSKGDVLVNLGLKKA